jgi:hypothetical protein
MHNMSQRATPRKQRIAYTTWHTCHVARSIMRTIKRGRSICDTGRLRVADATRNAHRCNAPRADALCNMRRAPMHRATCTGAASTDATCNMRRAPMQHATRADASMPHATMRHVDATYKAMYCSDATRADATRVARRCNVLRAPMQHAHRIPHGASCTACTWAAPGRYVASAHSRPRCMHPSIWNPRHAVHDERRRIVRRMPRARCCAALRVPMGSPLRQR